MSNHLSPPTSLSENYFLSRKSRNLETTKVYNSLIVKEFRDFMLEFIPQNAGCLRDNFLIFKFSSRNHISHGRDKIHMPDTVVSAQNPNSAHLELLPE